MNNLNRMALLAVAAATTLGWVGALAACIEGDETPVVRTGTGADEILEGCDGEDVLAGEGGRDQIYGRGRDDALAGGGGNDKIFAGPGNDHLGGGDSDDELFGEGGQDRFEGGPGVDWVAFLAAQRPGVEAPVDVAHEIPTQGAVASLRTRRISNDGFGNSELMTSVEGFGLGTPHADRFEGDNGRNFFDGVGAGDVVFGGGGYDVFHILDAPSRIDGGSAKNSCNFRGYRYVIEGGQVVLEWAPTGVEVDLAAETLRDGWRGAGVIRNCLDLGGTPQNDRLSGEQHSNIIDGGPGDDAIDGRGGDDWLNGDQGADILVGGAGADQFRYYGITSSLVSAVDRIFDFSQAQGDRISLWAIDADPSTPAKDAFAFVAAETMDFVAGSVTFYRQPAANETIVHVSTANGQRMAIRLSGLIVLRAEDFEFEFEP